MYHLSEDLLVIRLKSLGRECLDENRALIPKTDAHAVPCLDLPCLALPCVVFVFVLLLVEARHPHHA
jgi:hypothetical protein